MKKTPILLFLLPTVLLADVVYLKGAGTISGQIVEQTDEAIMVNVGDGVMGVPMSRVERIEKVRSPLDEYDERASKLGPQDVNGWRGLGRWATQKGMYTQSRQAYQKVLTLAPNDAEANEALGFVSLDGRWVTEEEGYRARGYVQYEGEWMTPAEAQTLQASAAAEEARRATEQRARDAELAAQEAEARARESEARAKEAEARAKEAEDAQRYSNPVYWGGWGYGVTTWPTVPVVNRPVTRPSTPVRVPR